MKTIGLIGGMSWESSIEYYRIINQGIQNKLGGVHSAKIVMASLDFAEIEQLQSQGNWDEATRIMVETARLLEMSGADMVLICTNTMHLMADKVEAEINVPLLHIADSTALAIIDLGLKTVGLLGTRFTMEEEFYRVRLEKKHKLKVLIPNDKQRVIVHKVIYDELVKGRINEKSREMYGEIIDSLIGAGAEGIILGCTEIGLLVKQEDTLIPVFDTTEIHAQAAVDAALESSP